MVVINEIGPLFLNNRLKSSRLRIQDVLQYKDFPILIFIKFICITYIIIISDISFCMLSLIYEVWALKFYREKFKFLNLVITTFVNGYLHMFVLVTKSLACFNSFCNFFHSLTSQLISFLSNLNLL